MLVLHLSEAFFRFPRSTLRVPTPSGGGLQVAAIAACVRISRESLIFYTRCGGRFLLARGSGGSFFPRVFRVWKEDASVQL